MGLQLSAHGTREGVLNHVASNLPGEKLPVGTDKSQVDAVRDLVQKEIGALPAEFNGCRLQVEASAHPGQARTVQVTIIPQKLHL